MCFVFLTIENVIKIHLTQIEIFGGIHGIRDISLLDSAIKAPCQTFDRKLLYKNAQEVSAAYIFHIIKNHPLIDGNKRTGVIAGLMFLKENNYKINLSQKEFFLVGIGVANSSVNFAELVKIINKNCSK